ERLDERSKQETLDEQTRHTKKGRHFQLDGLRYLPLPAGLRRAFPPLLRDYAGKLDRRREKSPRSRPPSLPSHAKRGRERGTFRVEDVALRVAGIGSLGRIRFAAVVSDGRREWLLDLK